MGASKPGHEELLGRDAEQHLHHPKLQLERSDFRLGQGDLLLRRHHARCCGELAQSGCDDRYVDKETDYAGLRCEPTVLPST